MPKIDQEKRTLIVMIKIYCRKKHHTKHLCAECQALLSYALNRLDHCRYGENKGFCKHCPSHCYNKANQLKIRKVMGFSGPQLIFYHPIMVIRHLLS
ncbi:nitrous oxide-stimulated promoter family protein [Acetobacterium wieringae]|uniref:nitrous oxide-stimulated promoter family protein n=1 Tax=Acetobacterium wieringae TaxID=52694 RepID=UPI0026EC72F7|nr:nitrous oxide-stimulated promoter family protein [Acetobacterium wieringae]